MIIRARKAIVQLDGYEATLTNKNGGERVDSGHFHAGLNRYVLFLKQKKNAQELDTAGMNALGDADVEKTHYWLYAPGERASMWGDFYKKGIMGLGWYEIGDLNQYSGKKEIAEKMKDVYGSESSYKNSAYAVWQFSRDIKPGDVIFAKKGRTEILGKGIVQSDYEYDESSGEYPHIRKVEWLKKGSWHTDELFAMKTLTDLTDYPNFVAKINSFFDDEAEDETDETVIQDCMY